MAVRLQDSNPRPFALAQPSIRRARSNPMLADALCGWVAGVHPPGINDDFARMLTVVRHLLVAHTRAYHAIHSAPTAAEDVAPSGIYLV